MNAIAPHRVPDKEIATLAARCALLGYTFHNIEGDLQPQVFIVSRSAETREFDGLDEVHAWLDQLGGNDSGGTN